MSKRPRVGASRDQYAGRVNQGGQGEREPDAGADELPTMPPPPARPRVPFRWAGDTAGPEGVKPRRAVPRGVGLLPAAGPGAHAAGPRAHTAGPQADALGTLLDPSSERWWDPAVAEHRGHDRVEAGGRGTDNRGTSSRATSRGADGGAGGRRTDGAGGRRTDGAAGGVKAHEILAEQPATIEMSTEVVPELRLPKPGRTRRVILVASALLLAAGLVGAGVLIGLRFGLGAGLGTGLGLGPRSGPSGVGKGTLSRPPTGRPPTRQPPTRQPPAAVATFAGLLSASARAGGWTRGAVAGACRLSAPGAEYRQALVVQVGGAISLYESVLAQARGKLSAGSWTGGRALGVQLVTADTRALGASEDFQAWLVDLQATGCYGGPTNDLHYQEAMAASKQALEASQRLASAWAPVAGRYQLPSWEPSQI